MNSHDDCAEKLLDAQSKFQDLDYDNSKYAHDIAVWKLAVKQLVDWFIVQYDAILSKRCVRAARLLNMGGDSWEDLKSECQIEAYYIAGRFDPEKGDFVKYLLTSLWLHMFRRKYINRYNTTLQTDSIETIESVFYEHDFCDDQEPDVNSLLKGLDWHERTLLNCKMVLNMSNGQIAAMLGLNSEGTVRKRLQNVLDKIKISGT